MAVSLQQNKPGREPKSLAGAGMSQTFGLKTGNCVSSVETMGGSFESLFFVEFPP
jgi:hypothetical protein